MKGVCKVTRIFQQHKYTLSSLKKNRFHRENQFVTKLAFWLLIYLTFWHRQMFSSKLYSLPFNVFMILTFEISRLIFHCRELKKKYKTVSLFFFGIWSFFSSSLYVLKNHTHRQTCFQELILIAKAKTEWEMIV